MNNDQNVVFDIELAQAHKKRIVFYLYDDTHPTICKYFRDMAIGIHGLGYKSTYFNSVFQNRYTQGGDFESNINCFREKQIYAKEMGESYMFKHTRRGLLSMNISDPCGNKSQFLITFGPCPYFDDKYIVFGEVAQESYYALDWIEYYASEIGQPTAKIQIIDCGIWKDFKSKKFELEFDWTIKKI